jgi:hypothetical protein
VIADLMLAGAEEIAQSKKSANLFFFDEWLPGFLSFFALLFA